MSEKGIDDVNPSFDENEEPNEEMCDIIEKIKNPLNNKNLLRIPKNNIVSFDNSQEYDYIEVPNAKAKAKAKAKTISKKKEEVAKLEEEIIDIKETDTEKPKAKTKSKKKEEIVNPTEEGKVDITETTTAKPKAKAKTRSKKKEAVIKIEEIKVEPEEETEEGEIIIEDKNLIKNDKQEEEKQPNIKKKKEQKYVVCENCNQRLLEKTYKYSHKNVCKAIKMEKQNEHQEEKQQSLPIEPRTPMNRQLTRLTNRLEKYKQLASKAF